MEGKARLHMLPQLHCTFKPYMRKPHIWMQTNRLPGTQRSSTMASIDRHACTNRMHAT